jgi:hypothetical protein
MIDHGQDNVFVIQNFIKNQMDHIVKFHLEFGIKIRSTDDFQQHCDRWLVFAADLVCILHIMKLTEHAAYEQNVLNGSIVTILQNHPEITNVDISECITVEQEQELLLFLIDNHTVTHLSLLSVNFINRDVFLHLLTYNTCIEYSYI